MRDYGLGYGLEKVVWVGNVVWVGSLPFLVGGTLLFRVGSYITSIVGTTTAPSDGFSLDVFAGELFAVDFAGELFAVDFAGELCCEVVPFAFVFAFPGERCSLSARRVLLFAAAIAVPASLGVFPVDMSVTAGKKNMIRQEKTRQGKTRQEKTRQGKARRDKKRQDKTRQDKKRQDKTRR